MEKETRGLFSRWNRNRLSTATGANRMEPVRAIDGHGPGKGASFVESAKTIFWIVMAILCSLAVGQLN